MCACVCLCLFANAPGCVCACACMCADACVHVCVCVRVCFEFVRGIHKDKDVCYSTRQLPPSSERVPCRMLYMSFVIDVCLKRVLCMYVHKYIHLEQTIFFLWRWKKKNPGFVKGACPAMSKSKGERDSYLQGLVRINTQTDEKHPLNIESCRIGNGRQVEAKVKIVLRNKEREAQRIRHIDQGLT